MVADQPDNSLPGGDTTPPGQNQDAREPNGRWRRGVSGSPEKRWKKGQPSPNPSGRPKMAGEVARRSRELAQLALEQIGTELEAGTLKGPALVRAFEVLCARGGVTTASEFAAAYAGIVRAADALGKERFDMLAEAFREGGHDGSLLGEAFDGKAAEQPAALPEKSRT